MFQMYTFISPPSFNPLFSGCREQEPETKVKQQLWKLLPRKRAVLKTNNWQRRLQGSNQLFSCLPFLAARMLCIFSFYNNSTTSGPPQTTIWTPVNRSQGPQEVHLRLQPLRKQLQQMPSKSLTLPTLCPWDLPERYFSFLQAIVNIDPSANPHTGRVFPTHPDRLVPQVMFVLFLTPACVICFVVSGGNCRTEKMQWRCKSGHCQPFCQKSFGRLQQEEMNEIFCWLFDQSQISHSVVDHHLITSRTVSTDQLLRLHLDQCTYKVWYDTCCALCHQNIMTDSATKI